MKRHLFATLLTLMTLTASADDVNSLFTTPSNMTDQEAEDSKNFVHQGRKDRLLQTGCQEKGLDKCDVGDVDSKGVLFDSAIGAQVEQNIGRLYGILFGATGFLTGSGGPKVTVVEKAEKGQTQLKAKDLTKDDRKAISKDGSTSFEKDGNKGEAEAKSDYCIYAAMGYEAVAGMIQSALQKKIEESTANISDVQLRSLVALKETHRARKRTSTYQSVTYGATSACYIARAAASKGRVVMDWKYWAKMSASAGLSTLYALKANAHAKKMEAVQAVIDSLPKAGDCNPWTGTTCFCAEPTSKTLYPSQYQEVCVENNGDPEVPRVSLGCGAVSNGQMTFDQECKCKETNTCYKTSLKTFNPKFSLGKNFMNETNKGYDMLSSGQFNQGQFDKYSMQNAATATSLKGKIDVPPTPALNLNEEQKKIADSLKDVVPPAVASLAATTPPANLKSGGVMSTGNAALSALPDKLKKQLNEAEVKAKYSNKGSGYESVSAPEEDLALPTMPGQESQAGGTEVMTFAEKAVSKADMTNNPETPIFDIISNRYRHSLNKLEAQEKK